MRPTLPDDDSAQYADILSRLQRLEQTLKNERIAGMVLADGTSDSDAFTSSRTAAGDYVVIFTPPFSAPPVVTLTLGQTGPNPRAIKIKDSVPVTANGFSVWTYTVAPALTDSEFYFTAELSS